MSTGMEIVLADVGKTGDILRRKQEDLDRWCSGGEVRGEALIRYAMAEMQVNEDLRNCTPTSIYLALLSCSVTGLVPGKLRGFSYLVPFYNSDKKVMEATFMMGWKGVKHIGYRAGLHLISAVIHENDKFDYDVGTNKFVTYKPALRGQGAEIGAAAWVELPRGGLEVEYLDMPALERVRAAATRFRKSPAWDGPFADQMRRKTALKRLGKQVEMGEEFLKADAIEIANEEGNAARVLDELTDGAATRFTAQESKEAATFAALPRPTVVQVPAAVTATDTGPAKQPAKEQATHPPQAGGSTTKSPAPSRPATQPKQTSSSAPSEQKDSRSSAAERPTQPAASSNTSPSPAASAPTPAAISPSSSPTTPSTNSASTSSAATSSPADGAPEPGDVAGEPSPDDAFDTSFGADLDDPVDRPPAKPSTAEEWFASFLAYVAPLGNREAVLKESKQWLAVLSGWLASCKTRDDMTAKKETLAKWTVDAGLINERRADPKKGIERKDGDPETNEIKRMWAQRWTELG